MSTKALMIASSFILAVGGVAMTFAPDEIVGRLVGQSNMPLTLLVQVIGAAYLGFSAINWMGRSNLIGGIYSRPVAVGNLMHFLVAGIALIKAAAAGGEQVVVAAAVVYGILAVAFGWVTFGLTPGAANSSPGN